MKILIVVAHPDDLDFGCAGSTARWVGEGHDVAYCLVTKGQAGGFDPSISREEMAEIREKEQRAAAAAVGVTELHFLEFQDGQIEATPELRRAITRIIRLTKPDRVVTQSPERNLKRMYSSHPDHLATGEATLCAVYPDARNQFAFPELLADEGLEPHTVPAIWIMGGPNADEFVDITDTIDQKIAALLCHKSQMREPEAMPDRIRQRAIDAAAAGDLDEGRLAEAFRLVDTT